MSGVSPTQGGTQLAVARLVLPWAMLFNGFAAKTLTEKCVDNNTQSKSDSSQPPHYQDLTAAPPPKPGEIGQRLGERWPPEFSRTPRQNHFRHRSRCLETDALRERQRGAVTTPARD